ncbi:MAG: DUF2029 domain-containing protein [Bacteroidetes bacterium]|nr:DUF2029 domain-containing protein [Bacteroidota bacterium]
MEKINIRRFLEVANQPLMLLFMFAMLLLNLWRLSNYQVELNQPLDWRQLYCGHILFAEGENPYNDAALKQVWADNVPEAKDLPAPGAPENRLVYPPQAIFLCHLFLPWSWQSTRWMAWGIALLSLLLIPFVSSRTANWKDLLLALLVLISFRGTSTALVLAQPALPVILLLMAALHFRKSRKNISGILLGLSFFKPSLALPILFFFTAEKNWKPIIYAIGLNFVFYLLMYTQLGLDFLLQIIQSWLGELQLQAQIIFESGHSFLNGNMTDLSAALFRLFGLESGWLNLPLLLIGSLLLLALYRKGKLKESELLLLLVLLSYLFSYHLYYDLMLLPVLMLSYYRMTNILGWLCLLLYLPWGHWPQLVSIQIFILLLLFILIWTRKYSIPTNTSA